MIGTTTSPALVTGEELAQRPDLGRCELVEGRVVEMSPTGHRHGDIEVRFAVALSQWAASPGRGRVLGGEVGIYTRRHPDTVRGADVLYISHERYATNRSPSYLDVAPEVVVEVLSPDDRALEVSRKRDEYLAIGVLVVLVVDPAARSVYAYRSATDVRGFGEGDTLVMEDVLPGFTLDVRTLFAG